MIRQSTLDKWKPIIDGYDKKQCSLKEYCLKNNISQKSYARNKLLIYGHNKSMVDSSFLPAFVVPESKEETFSINGVSISVDASIDDEILKRIIRICSEL